MHAHKMLKIEHTIDEVKIAGNKIDRPSSISPMQWVEYWEKLYELMEKEEYDSESDEDDDQDDS